MIIGKGLLATAFSKVGVNEDCIIFSSGVSNSQETSESEFSREKSLVMDTLIKNPDLKFIYFSTVLAGFSKSPYCKHKLEIEDIIKRTSISYIIFRVPQVVGDKGNKNNLVNFLLKSIVEKNKIYLNPKTKRSLLDVDDLVKIVNYCKSRCTSCTVVVSGVEKIKVFDICKHLSTMLDIAPIIEVTKEIEHCDWDLKNSKIANEAILHLAIDSTDYTKKVLNKYVMGKL